MSEIKYKVVKRTCGKGRFVSCWVQGKASTVYEIGKKAEVPDFLADLGYYPLVFDSIASAEKYIFATYGKNALADLIEILECDVERKVVELPQMLSCAGLFDGDLVCASFAWPSGAEMWESVTPIGIVPKEEWVHKVEYLD